VIDNEYAFTPLIELDLARLKQITLANLNTRVPGLASHQRLVSSDEYLLSLNNKFPFLSNLYNIYEAPQRYVTPVHVDSARFCALNIPIINTENSYTVFYKPSDELVSTKITHRAYHLVNSNVTEVFRFTLTSPTLINTKIPHGVLDSGDETRIIISWSISDQYSYEETKNLLS
jgi:hypothetical protein